MMITLNHHNRKSTLVTPRGFFIVFEGLDGAGLSTHSKLLTSWFRENGRRKILHTSEPTDAPVGSLIRSILRHYVNVPRRPDLMALLYAADRYYHVYSLPYGPNNSNGPNGGGLSSALKDGYVVISDRYILSTLAYQGVPYERVRVSREWLQMLNRGLPTPDLTIFLDVSPRESMSRISSERNLKELYENRPYLEAAFRNFKKLVRDRRFGRIEIVPEMINGRPRTIEETQNDIRSRLARVFEE